MISWPDIWILYRRELRSALRESNIILYSILVPVLLYPLMVWMMMSALSFVSGVSEERTARVALSRLPDEHLGLRQRLEAHESFVVVHTEDPLQALERREVELVLEFEPAEGGGHHVRLHHDAARDLSRNSVGRAREALDLYRRHYLEHKARELDLGLEVLQPFWIENRNLSSGTDVGRFLLGILLPFTLIVILSIAGMYPAIDSTAGERERGTWETLMTCATGRVNLVLAKYFYVCTMASLAGLLNLGAMLFSMRSIIAPLSRDMANDLSFTISPGSLLVIVAGSVLMAMMIGAGMMVLASFARTFREGQAMVTPVFMLTLLPVSLVSDATLKFTTGLALVPVVNLALVWREAIHGTYQWQLVAITFAVQLACVTVAVWIASRILAYEDLLLGSYDGSFWRFVWKRVLKR